MMPYRMPYRMMLQSHISKMCLVSLFILACYLLMQPRQDSALPLHPNIMINHPNTPRNTSAVFRVRSDYMHHNICSNPSHPAAAARVRSPQDLINLGPELGVLWCPVFKAGSSKWLDLFCGVLSKNGPCPIRTLRKHNPCLEPRQECVQAEQSVFMVVRHPILRFISAFQDKFELWNNKDMGYWEYISGTVLKYRKMDALKYNSSPVELMAEASTFIKQNQPRLHDLRTQFHRNTSYKMTSSDHALVHNASNPYLSPPGPTLGELVRWVLEGGTDVHITPFHQYCAPCTLDYLILKLEGFPGEAMELLDVIQHPELKGVLNEGFTIRSLGSLPPKSDDCIVEYFRSVPTNDFKLIYDKMWKIDCEIYQYDCKTIYDKVIERGPNNKKFVIC